MIQVKLCSVPVTDQARARRFYTEVLGFRIKHDFPADAAGNAWLTVVAPVALDGIELLLEPVHGMATAVVFQEDRYARGIPATMWATDDIDAEYARLTGLGVVFKGAPAPLGPTRGCAFDDTCGNWIQLYQG
jgi:catechol 2,3-dioxygenase-like lactoylglutathione lyase family enzyme